MKILIKLLILLSAVAGAFFGFFFVILSALNGLNFTGYESLVNYFVFFGSLLMIALAFFYRKRFKIFYLSLLSVFTILCFIPFFSIPTFNYIFLLPSVLYFISMILVVIN